MNATGASGRERTAGDRGGLSMVAYYVNSNVITDDRIACKPYPPGFFGIQSL